MAVVRRYPTMVLANAAAAHLRRGGVPASAVEDRNPWQSSARVEVDDSLRALAGRLIREFDAELPQLDPDWEDQAIPDLSRLPRGLAPPCPRCDRPLPLDASLPACPACGGEVDVVGLLLDRFGPDVLEACYEDTPLELSEELLDAAALHCGCGYPLLGLLPAGKCPECGGDYDKRRIILGS